MARINKCSFRQFVNNVQQQQLQVWLFGCGEKGRKFISKYKTTAVIPCIEGFIDNASVQQGNSIIVEKIKFPVISLQQFVKRKKENAVILITSSYVLEILGQLDHIEELNNTPCYIDYLLEELYEPQEFSLAKNRKQCIPKKIHYCWFGQKDIPAKFKEYMKTWTEKCPDYEVIRWDETNYDINKCPYIKEAYENKKWAFVSDYVRLDVLNEYGGIYLDTDIEIVKNLDDFLSYDFFCGFERNNYIAFGLGVGSIQHHRILENLLDTYNHLHFIENGMMNLTPCSEYHLDAILNYGFEHDNKYQVINNVAVFPSEVFAPENTLHITNTETEHTYSIHHYSSTWWSNDQKVALNKVRERIISCLKY